MINAYFFYKIANFFWRFKIPLLPQIIKFVIFIIYNSSIPYQCNIGKGTRLGYGGIGVIIHKKAIIGSNVRIGSNVTIGGKQGQTELPVVGNNVQISTGAKVLGNVRIGNNSIIGANAVVLTDMPENSVFVGVPAKQIRQV